MQQFEHTAVFELGPLFLEHGVDPLSAAGVLQYVKGLQDWQSGGHEWHMRSSRYMNTRAQASRPLGMSSVVDLLGAKRLRGFTHVPYQRVGPSRIPELYVPSDVRLSSHLEAARRNVVVWCGEMGILEPRSGVAGSAVWDEAKLVDFDFALCAAGLHPDASPEELDLATLWLTWGTYADDYFPVVFGRSRNLSAAKVAVDRLGACMPLDCSPAPPPASALERGLADVWARTAGPMPVAERRKLRATVEEMCASWLWELANEIAGHVPDPVDYMEMRRLTFGAQLTMSLSRLRHTKGIPEEFYASGPMVALENAMSDGAILVNDVYSYQKEIEFGGELHNCVLVVQSFFDCDYPAALDIVRDLQVSRVRQFEHIVAHELPIACDDFGLDVEARDDVAAFVAELRDWLASVHNWHRHCSRYDEPSLLRHHAPRPWRLGGPTGLGTSAAIVEPTAARGGPPAGRTSPSCATTSAGTA
ncbi:hypothetical protein ACFQYP_54955 [Nonomuraea antimicrobica]